MTISATRRTALLGMGALSLVSLGETTAAARVRRRPNIVFILADDMGYADVACYGRTDVRTPAIDSLARDGIQLLQGYANSAVCSATRTALMTGRYQYRLPIGLEEPLAGSSGNVGLPPEHPTLPSMLRASGYRTALIGKWHLGELPDFGPLKSGYEEFFGFRGGALDYFSHKGARDQDDLWRQDQKIEMPGYFTNLVGQQAVDFIDRSAALDRPFFLSMHFNAPHWPWEGPHDSAEARRIAGTGLRHLDGGSRKTYLEMIEAMDAEVDRVLKTLARHGIREDTIVVFTSDNGGERFADTWPFSGQKTELLEGGLRVPSLISWPNGLPRGQQNDQVSITMDWVATLLSAAGVAPDRTGKSEDAPTRRLRALGSHVERLEFHHVARAGQNVHGKRPGQGSSRSFWVRASDQNRRSRRLNVGCGRRSNHRSRWRAPNVSPEYASPAPLPNSKDADQAGYRASWHA